jgi:signal transduction histidine kinase
MSILTPAPPSAWLAARERTASETVEIIANMAHDLRAPLNAIVGFTEFVSDEKAGPLNAAQREYLGDVLSSGRTLLGLLNDLTCLVKIDSGRLESSPRATTLAEPVTRLCEQLRPVACLSNILLTCEVQAETGPVRADPDQLTQIIANLCSHSIDFAGCDGRVNLLARVPSAEAVEVSISALTRGTAVDRVESTLRSAPLLDQRFIRTGSPAYLNLAVTRRLVELAGGSLQLMIADELQGTRLIVRFPTQ